MARQDGGPTNICRSALSTKAISIALFKFDVVKINTLGYLHTEIKKYFRETRLNQCNTILEKKLTFEFDRAELR